MVGCQEDDVCVEEKTPRMTILFLNSNTNEPITLDSIIIGTLNNQNTYEDVLFLDTNIAQVGLSLQDLSTTQLRFRRSNVPATTNDLLQLNYQAQEQYASKACGVKLNYSNLSLGSTNLTNIQNIELQNTQITNEQDTILYIYYNN